MRPRTHDTHRPGGARARTRSKLALTLAAALAALSVASLPAARADYSEVMGARLPTERYGSSAVWTGRYAFVFGGYDYISTPPNLDQILRYDPLADTVAIMLARLPSGRTHTAAVWTGEHAYVFGGAVSGTSTRFRDVVRYDPATDATTLMGARFPSDWAHGAAVWTGEHVFLFGGCCASDGRWPPFYYEIFRYTPATDTLAVMGGRLRYGDTYPAAVWDPRDNPEVGCAGGCAYVFGGQEGSHRDRITRYNPATDTALEMTTRLPGARGGTVAVWDGDDAYVLGGIGDGRDWDEILRYRPDTDSLSVMPGRLPAARLQFGAVWTGRAAYTLGGLYGPGCCRTSPAASALVGRYVPFPRPPRDLAAASGPGPGEITLTWSAPAFEHFEGIAHYRIYRGTAPGGETFLAEVGDVRTYTDRGLAPGATYYYQVTAVAEPGESDRSNRASASTPAENVPPTADFTFSPAAPTTATTIQFTDRSTDPDGTIAVWSWAFGDGATSAERNPQHRYASPGTYTVTLTVTDDDGLEGTVPRMVGVTSPALAAPRSVRAAPGPGAGEITVSWMPPATGAEQVTAYRIYRAAASGRQRFLAEVGAEAASYTDAGLVPRGRYYYQVSAVYGALEGPRSAEASARAALLPGAVDADHDGIPDVLEGQACGRAIVRMLLELAAPHLGSCPSVTNYEPPPTPLDESPVPGAVDADGDGVPDAAEPLLCAVEDETTDVDGRCEDDDYDPPRIP